MRTPLISIVTVCWNAASTIGETLASVDAVLATTAPGRVEHLIVDGESKDDTLRIVGRHDHPARRVVSERDRGIYDAMNKGLRLARGEYVWYLNSDDLLHPRLGDGFARLLESLEAGRAECLVGEIEMFRGASQPLTGTRYWRVPADARNAMRFGWHPPHPAFVARRELLRDHGGFDQSKRIAADYKLMEQVVRGGARIVLLAVPLVAMREGGASNGSVRAIVAANRECYRSLRELGLSRLQAGSSVFAKLARKVAQKFVRPRLAAGDARR